MEQPIFPKVPGMIHDTTGGNTDIEGIRDQFFEDIIRFVGFNERAIRAFTDRRYQSICDPVPGGRKRRN